WRPNCGPAWTWRSWWWASWAPPSAPTRAPALWASSSTPCSAGEGCMPRDALDQPVTAVPGIGPARARLLEKLAIYTVEDLLCFAPRRHLDARRVVSVQELVPGLRATVAGRVVEAERRPTRTAGLWLARAVVEDDAGGRLELVAFARGKGGRRPAYVPLPASPGDFILASGVPERGPDGVWRMPRAEVEPLERGGLHTGRLVPEYPLTAGLTQRMMRRMVQAALDAFADEAREFLPGDVSRRHRRPPRGPPFRRSPFPATERRRAEARARPVLRNWSCWAWAAGSPLTAGLTRRWLRGLVQAALAAFAAGAGGFCPRTWSGRTGCRPGASPSGSSTFPATERRWPRPGAGWLLRNCSCCAWPSGS